MTNIDGPQRQGIRNYHNFAEIEGTIKDFRQFYDVGLIGASDIDFCYERHNAFLFMEEKVVHENYLDLPIGQAILLDHLYDSLYQPSQVLVIGRQKSYGESKTNLFYYIGIKELFKYSADVSGTNVKCKRVSLSHFKGPYTPSQFAKKIKELTKEF